MAPAALLLSLAAGDWLARREGLRGPLRIAPPATALAVLGVSLFLAAAFFDMSWDGLWYHQTAVYQMAHGWNPLRDPMHSFAPHLQDWLRHYAKGPWYVALALFQTTPHIEWAKARPVDGAGRHVPCRVRRPRSTSGCAGARRSSSPRSYR